MAEKSTNHVSLLAALVIGITGLIPVAWLLTTPSAEPAVAAEEVVVETSITTSPPETTVAVSDVPELNVDELDASIVRVLQANGYAELAPEADVSADISPAITRVLIDRGAVLTVVEEDPTSGEG
jgi:hypothetical protein